MGPAVSADVCGRVIPLHQQLNRVAERLEGSRISQYVIVLLAVAAVSVLRALCEPVLHNRSAYEVFLIAVAIVGLTCDLTPTLLTIVFGAVAGDFFFSEPRFSLHELPVGWWMLAVYLVSSSAVAFAAQAHRRSTRRLRSTLADIERVQDALRQQAALLDLSADAILVWELDGAITYWNRGAEALYGFTAAEAVGQVSHRLLKTIRPRTWDEFREHLLRDQLLVAELTHTTREGRTVVVESRHQMIRSRDGRRLVLESCRDVSQRRRDEETVRRAEKLVAAAQMASTLAHEINNPLAAAVNLTFLFRGDPELPQHLRQQAALLDGELTRVSHIVRETLNLYREDSRAALPVRPRDIVDEVLRSHAPVLEGIAVERRYGFEGSVEVNRSELFQAVSNLVLNAAEACSSSPGSAIKVHVFASGDWRHPERHGLRIVVADSGSGITRQDHRQLVEPFFTTKRQKGAGLGLSVVQWIAAKYGGSLHIRSSTRPGRSGTAVSVFLGVPAESKEKARPQSVRAARRSQAS